MQCRFGIVAGLGFILFPFFTYAACLTDGYTVVFVNGIFNTEQQARKSSERLQFILGKSFNS